ncbi:hypothetical protein IAU60_005852 [Kwoniella sp. DSM 27419]
MTTDGQLPSYAQAQTKDKPRRVICCIGTGGTIASEPTPGGLAPTRQDTFFRRIRSHPSLTSPSHFTSPSTSFASPVETTSVGKNVRYPRLVTPELDDEGTEVEYDILDLDQHMDSSEMTPGHWNTIASLVHENWDNYDGFVILSGTDTLIPLSRPRSDGWTNILDSLFVVGTLPYAGVGIVFHHQVLLGSRASKTSPNLFGAFTSPSVPPVINLNVKITQDSKISLPLRSGHPPPPLISLRTEPSVLSVHIYPGMTGSILASQVEAVPTCRAVIISAYGSGNLPINEESGVLASLKRLVERELLVVVISQCAIPNVYPLYTQGRTLLSIGVLPGYDLTHEAAFAKLVWVVSKPELSFKQRQALFGVPIAGEMSLS